MKKSLLILSALTATLALACNDAPKEESATETTPMETTVAPATESVASDNAMNSDMPDAGQAPASVPVTTPASAASGKKLNPPHGEPGHICEIPVGEPLPDNNAPGGVKVQTPPPANLQDPNAGKPSSPAPVSIMNQSAPVAQPAAAPGKTAPGMNPPHGEPGHDCAIPVGAPLKK